MKTAPTLTQKITRDALISILLYALPVALLFFTIYLSGARPWEHHGGAVLPFKVPHFLEAVFKNLSTWGLPVIMVVLGIVEFAVGLYENKWTKNERILDIVCFIAPKFVIRPFIAYFGFTKNILSRKIILAWNFICLALLTNIVVNALLSAPFPFQQFAFDQPNIAILYFPFSWLPSFVVPVVLFGHLVSIRRLIKS